MPSSTRLPVSSIRLSALSPKSFEESSSSEHPANNETAINNVSIETIIFFIKSPFKSIVIKIELFVENNSDKTIITNNQKDILLNFKMQFHKKRSAQS